MNYKVIPATVIATGCLIAIIANSLQAEEKTAPQAETTSVSVVGRLSLEARGKNEQLILHGKDAKIYQIQGELREKLKSILSDLGKDNLVSLSGTIDSLYSTSCTTNYSFSDKGEKIVSAQCFRYYIFNVTQINETKKSNEEIPPPERDIAEEQKAKASALRRPQLQNTGPQIGQLKGIITALNFRSPIKTIKVTFRDKNKKPVKKSFILGSGTYIAKKQPGSEGMMRVDIESLRKGQEISIGYSRDELKGRTDALFITIIKE